MIYGYLRPIPSLKGDIGPLGTAGISPNAHDPSPASSVPLAGAVPRIATPRSMAQGRYSFDLHVKIPELEPPASDLAVVQGSAHKVLEKLVSDSVCSGLQLWCLLRPHWTLLQHFLSCS